MVCGQETSMILFRLGTGFLRIEVPIFFNWYIWEVILITLSTVLSS
jgi:hypothetical protein